MFGVKSQSYFLFLKKRERRQSPVVKQTAAIAAKTGIGGAFANTFGFVNNAAVGQAVDDRRFSWLRRLSFRRKTVDHEEESVYETDNATGKKKLRKFSMRKKSNWSERGTIFDYLDFFISYLVERQGFELKRYF